ncbi:MAG: O-antigen ligase family protein [Pseudomonadota bacterium]
MATATTPDSMAYTQTPVISTAKLSNFLIGLAVFLGGFVIFEPAPYELLLAGLLFLFFLFGMRLPLAIFPLLIATITFSLGGIISSFMIDDYQRGLIYNAITLFLGLTSVFYALVIAQEMGRLRLIFRVYVVAAVATSSLGILGYFNVPGFGMFTRYERAQGAFADPNVFAPFLMPAVLYLIYGILNRSVTVLPIRAGCLAIILMAVFLAFSRAGWGLCVLTVGLYYLLLLATTKSSKMRIKYILMGVAGLAALIIGLIAALQVEAISSLFAERAKFVQSYDGDRLGRFARHAIGFELAMSKPFGIGNLEFGFLYGEDEHNVYLRSLLSYGWLGFVSWLALVLWPVIIGFKMLFQERPWQIYFQIAYVVLIGHLLVGWVIDIDHWRHVYLLLGVLWGCILLEQKRQKEMSARNLRTIPARPIDTAALPQAT